MIKCTAVFNSVSNVSGVATAQTRTGGWTESIYNTQAIDATREDFLSWCVLRARCLPRGFGIVGQRYATVGGSSITGGRRFPGDPSLSADVPQMAVQLRADASGAVNVRRWAYRGVPDIMIKEGEWLPTPEYEQAVKVAAQFAAGGNWRFFGRDLDNDLYDVASITTGGLLTIVDGLPFPAGTLVQLFRCKDASGRGVTGSYLVQEDLGDNKFQLVNFRANAVVSGQVRAVTTSPFAIVASSVEIEKVVVRKVGRPSGGYSGRHSRRK